MVRLPIAIVLRLFVAADYRNRRGYPVITLLTAAWLLQPPFTRSSPFTPAPFTPALHSANLDYHPSLCHSSPSNRCHPSLPHPSLLLFAAPPFTLQSATLYPHSSTLRSRSSVRRPSPFAPLPFTPALHSAALHPSFRHSVPSLLHPSLPLFSTPPFTLRPIALHSRHSLWSPSPLLPPFFTPDSPILHFRLSLRRP
jgi:hypothetical protein